MLSAILTKEVRREPRESQSGTGTITNTTVTDIMFVASGGKLGFVDKRQTARNATAIMCTGQRTEVV